MSNVINIFTKNFKNPSDGAPRRIEISENNAKQPSRLFLGAGASHHRVSHATETGVFLTPEEVLEVIEVLDDWVSGRNNNDPEVTPDIPGPGHRFKHISEAPHYAIVDQVAKEGDMRPYLVDKIRERVIPLDGPTDGKYKIKASNGYIFTERYRGTFVEMYKMETP